MAETTQHQDNDKREEGLDVPTLDVHDLVKPQEGAYYESEHHRPEALYQYGTVDTTDFGGGMHGGIQNVSPVFAEARAQNLVTAARALDPTDETVAPELVTLPEGSVTVTGTAKTADQGREDVAFALRRMADNPGVLGGVGPAQQAAAEEHDDDESDGRVTDDGHQRSEEDARRAKDSEEERRLNETNQASSTTQTSSPSTTGAKAPRSSSSRTSTTKS